MLSCSSHVVCLGEDHARVFRRIFAPDTRAGGGAPAMESRLSTLVTYGFGVRTSLEAPQPAKLSSFGGHSHITLTLNPLEESLLAICDPPGVNTGTLVRTQTRVCQWLTQRKRLTS